MKLRLYWPLCQNGAIPTHDHLESIRLTPDGRQLSIDYLDWPESGVQRFSHYVISLSSSPKLLTGGSPISIDAEKELAYEDIPRDVILDACNWLQGNATTARRKREPAGSILAAYHELLSQHLRPDLA